MAEINDFTLADLAKIIAERARSGDPGSYTAKLVGAGVGKCAKKFGEEAVEAALAAVAEDDAALTAEAADVLYHLLVMLEARSVPLDAVMVELRKRTAQSGLAEKASRRRGKGES
jgi:phosphoribosyl-ATP pyrophosphohydrolase